MCIEIPLRGINLGGSAKSLSFHGVKGRGTWRSPFFLGKLCLFDGEKIGNMSWLDCSVIPGPRDLDLARETGGYVMGALTFP